MKKFLTIIALLMAFVTPSLADKTVYLDATPSGNVNWPSGARFALYMYNSSGNAWKDFELKAGETYIYQATVPDEYTHIICVRMDGSTTENNWNNKWNQTQDIDISNFTEVINVKITGWDAASVSGPSTAAVISSVVLKGSYDSWGSGTALTEGTGNTWTGVLDLTDVTTNVDIKLLANTDGWVSFSDLTLDLGDNITLTQSGSNYSLNNATSGFKTYTITATWTEGPSAALGWTLKIAGKDERLVTENWTCTAGSVEALAYDLTDETAKVAIGEEQVEVTLNIKGSDFLIKGTKSGNTVTFAKGQECNVPIAESMMTVQAYGPSDGDITFTYSEVGDNKILTQNGIITLKAGGFAVATITGVVIESNPATAVPGTAIWTKDEPVSPNWGNTYILVDADKFANANVGDVLHVAVEGVTAGDEWSAQVVAYDGCEVQLEGGVPVGTGTVTDAAFVITGDMLTLLKANGLRITGNGYSSRKVSLESGVYTGSGNSIWVGNATMGNGDDWTQIFVSKYHFINAGAQEGSIIKVYYTGEGGIQLKKDWITPEAKVEYGDGYLTSVVSDAFATAYMDNQLIVNASPGITITQVELLSGNAVNEVALNLDGNGKTIESSEFDKYPDDYKVKLSFSNDTDPFASRNGWGIGQGSNSDEWGENDYSIPLTAKGGKTFVIWTTIGALKNAAKKGGTEYVPSQYFPEGGVTFNVYNDCSLSSVKVLVPVYRLITGEGSSWTVGDVIDETDGVYTATVSGEDKLFAIARGSALNTAANGILDWSLVVRPVTQDADWLINFMNYKGSDCVTEYNESGKVWVIGSTNDADVTINFTPASNSFTLSCEKTITMAAGYATYSNDQKFQVTGAEAYKVTAANGTSATLTKIDVENPVFAGGKYTKGTGIILKGASAVIKSVDYDAEVTAPNDVNNLMVGSGDETYIISGYAQELGNYTPYILMDGSNGVGFYKFVITGDTTEDEKKLAPHKAFLAAPENLAPFLSFDDEGGTTGISNVNVNHNDNQWYDLSGRRVENPTKGLYIMNGKKVIIK